MDSWQINLSLIPSIAVVLTSSNRMALGLTDEINVRLAQNLNAYKTVLPKKIKQLKRLSLSIVFMYISMAILVTNGLLTALNVIKKPYDLYVILLAICLFLIGLFLKIQFSIIAYKIRQEQFSHFLSESHKIS